MPDSIETGLRQRKKRQTRQAIQQAALQLFLEKGFEAATTSEIAQAANVSAGTLFNYFPTKEALLSDEFDPVFIRQLQARPPEEPLFTAVRRAMQAGLGEALAAGDMPSFARARLINSTPSLRAAAALERESSVKLLSQLLAERYGRPEEDFEVRVASAVLVTAVTVAYEVWLEGEGRADVRQLVDQALAVAEAGARLQM